jgi:hypothetical protein
MDFQAAVGGYCTTSGLNISTLPLAQFPAVNLYNLMTHSLIYIYFINYTIYH